MSWEEVKLKDITLKLASGSTPKGGKDSYIEEGISLIRSLNIHDFNFLYKDLAFIDRAQAKKLSNVIIEENDILINITGASVGRCTMVPKNVLPARVNQHVMIVRSNFEIIDANFLLYLINSKQYKSQLMLLSETGATREALTKDDISNFKIKLPLFAIQKKISKALSNYDDLIKNNNKRIKLLEEMAEEIYKEWFVRLRFPNYKNTKIIDDIPDGWDYSKLVKYLEFFRGKSYSSKDIECDEGLPFVNLKCINRNGGFRKDGIKVFCGQYKESNIAYSGDIMMAVTDMTQDRAIVGRVGRVPKMDYEKFIFSMDLVRIEPLDIDKTFLYTFLRFSNIGLYLKEFANGANVLHLTPDIIYKVDALIPSKNIQKKYTKIIDPLLKEIDILEQKNQNLKQTRDLLLPRLISGKLNIEDLDIK